MFGLKGGAVGVPRWILVFRVLQLFFAILIIALTAYALSVYDGGPAKPALIAALIIGILTIIPVLILITPLHIAQRKIYDPSIALLLELGALLFWLGAFAALASYHDVFSGYGRSEIFAFLGGDECRMCRSAWRAGVASTVFAALEFLLFLFTTLIFVYYFHHHIAGTTPHGIPIRSGRHNTHHTSSTTGTTATHHSLPQNNTATNDYEMSPTTTHTTTNDNSSHPGNPNYSVPSPPATGGYGGSEAPTSSGPNTGSYYGKGL
ncbi:hypothetical protein P280DRAFT_227536 [Massarina eburnea CBS 473.64]|uniref:MARVEL domain-containing protein n=1 Tax=Massarina eburnea CBS 473.64 TaxID=1395130 RepID=A0A6A6SAE3_9PLEO|nr:hypothetical protein P280DRAFT_227536 [Massarina eburnea CBS 473.64]